jgi:hypothetical protein
VLKRRDRGSRKLLDRTGGGTEHLELRDSPGKAINQRCQFEDGYDSPKGPGENEPTSVQTRVSFTSLLITDCGLHRERVLVQISCLVSYHMIVS